MITITILDTSQRKTDIVISGRNELLNMIMVMESSTVVKQYKISLSEGILIKDLYREFGIGQCSKFTIEFKYD